MRILIVSIFFPPMNSIASHRPYSWAKYWTLAGHEVTVLTTPKLDHPRFDLNMPNPGYQVVEVPPPPFVSSLKGNYQQSQNTANPFKKKFLDAYHYLRHNKGIFNACRMPDFADFWIHPALKELRSFEPWDLVVSTAGPYATHFVASKAKKARLAKYWIADFRDLWTDNHAFPGLFPFNLFEGWIEKQLLKTADAITIVSPSWAKNLTARHGPERVHVIENGFDPEDLMGMPQEAVFPDDGKYRLVHTGKIYPAKQDLELFFEAIKEFQKDPVKKLEVIFAGADLDFIEELRRKYRLEQTVKSIGFVKREYCLALQRDAHALLFFPWNDLRGTGTGLITGKIYEYLFSRTPILAIGGKGSQSAKQLIEDASAGYCIESMEGILKFLRQNLHKQKSSLSEGTLHSYTRKHLALKLLDLKRSFIS